eukprot:COSAG06_NODE_6678_length_2829_cov_7.901832_3_plen_282_part_00
MSGQPLSVAARTGAHPSRETGSRRGEPDSPHSSCSGKERRSELESVGQRKRHSPPALSSEVSHVHLATPLPEQLFAERPAAAADRLHGEDEARLRHQVAVAAATPAELVVGGVPEGRGGSVELACAHPRLLALSLELELAHLDAGGGGRRFSALSPRLQRPGGRVASHRTWWRATERALVQRAARWSVKTAATASRPPSAARSAPCRVAFRTARRLSPLAARVCDSRRPAAAGGGWAGWRRRRWWWCLKSDVPLCMWWRRWLVAGCVLPVVVLLRRVCESK